MTDKQIIIKYYLDKNFLDIAKEEIGEYALIKLIESGV